MLIFKTSPQNNALTIAFLKCIQMLHKNNGGFIIAVLTSTTIVKGLPGFH